MHRLAVLALLLVLALPAAAEAATWQPTRLPAGAQRLVEPVRAKAFAVDRGALRAQARGGRVALPAPDGSLVRFALRDAPVMEPGLARRHPEIRTYAGRAIGDRATTVRLAVTPLGVHASVRGSDGRAWLVEPALRGDARRHVSFLRSALPAEDHDHASLLPPIGPEPERAETAATRAGEPVALRTYRLALVSDPLYARKTGATEGVDPEDTAAVDARVLAAQAVLMHRVNQVYEADFAIRMLLVEGSERLSLNTPEEATGANGPCGVEACFTPAQLGTCSGGLLGRTTIVAGLLVGARNYDVGHIVLGSDGGGIAGLGVVGRERKAEGCTGLAKPVGDFFAIDYVAHELGHQFGGNHTFDGVNGSCAGPNRNLTGARSKEPGSGSTVMAYAGICLTDDLQPHTDPTFHQTSIEEMGAYVAGAESALSSVQQVAFRAPVSGPVVVRHGTAAATAPDASAAALKAAIDAVLPRGGTATVTTRAGGFAAAIGGGLAGDPVELLEVEAGGVPAIVGESVTGGPTTRGGATAGSGNRAPVVSAPERFTIPVRTPFALTASGEDADGDALTYVWEQDDPGLPGAGSLLFAPRAIGALFRTFGVAARYGDREAYESPSPGQNLPAADPARVFPDLAQVLADNTNARTGACPAAAPAGADTSTLVDCASEQLPTAAWTGVPGTGALHFRVTARDNHPGAGGTATADVELLLAKGAGPFRVLDLPAGRTQGLLPVAWDVARTDVLTGTSRVRISLSTDGGRTFPIVLAGSTPNDGGELLPVPAGVTTTKGRVKVEAVGNVFFDVSHTDIVL